jgi:tRNA-dihydrouridine synthase B
MHNSEAPLLNSQVPALEQISNFPLCMAPMVGLTHVALRAVARTYLPEGAQTLWPTEMLNSRRLPHEDFSKTPETMRAPIEDGLVPQILGNEEAAIQKSIVKLKDWGAVGIDINMGCPVQKALKHNYGVSLMGDSDYAADVVRMAVQSSNLPVSVKLRAGVQNDFNYLVQFVKKIENAGAQWICLHPRTAEQKRRGFADWNQIKDLKKQIQIPVIGNGDIQTAEDVLRMLQETGCDRVMSGRALAARPWMFWQVGEKLGWAPPAGRTGKAPSTKEEEGQEYGRCLLQLIQEMKNYFHEDLALRKLRFYIKTTSVWLLFGQELISIVTREKTLDAVEAQLARFFSQPVEMVPKTELRQ